MAGKNKRVSLDVQCLNGHNFTLGPGIEVNPKQGNSSPGFYALCPTCGGTTPLRNMAVAKFVELPETATYDQILIALGKDQQQIENQDPPAQNQKEAMKLLLKSINRIKVLTWSGGWGNSTTSSSGNEKVNIEAGTKPKTVIKPMTVSTEPEARVNSREDYIPTGQDVFLDIVQNSQLAEETVEFLKEWIAVESNWDDPRNVREALAKAACPFG